MGRTLTASPIVQADIAFTRARMCGEALDHEQIRFKGEPGERAKAGGQKRLDGIGPSSGTVGGKFYDPGALLLEASGKDHALGVAVISEDDRR
jgi:hypothetical protein